MARSYYKAGYSNNNLPYNRIGDGKRSLVIFDGLDFSHRLLSGLMLRIMASSVKHLAKEYAVYIVRRKPELPTGYSMRDMSNDYAAMIRSELGGPVDVMGLSTGGPIAQWFALDHPDLVHHLILAMTSYRLNDDGKRLQREFGNLAKQGKWRAAAACMATGMASGLTRPVLKSLFWLYGKGVFGYPANPFDGLVEIEAQGKHDFKKHLVEIKAPTLVIGGKKDFFYPVRETAAEIPNSKLILYEGVGHNAIMKRQFQKDVLAFLNS